MNAHDRFWSKVYFSPDCWLWVGADDRRYGQFWYDGGKVKAHRMAWVLEFGEIPNGLYVLHRCDNPPCVRPDHLFTGTLSDNTRDAIRKGRMTPGIKKSRCIRGHRLEGDNLYYRTDGFTECLTCKRLRRRKEYRVHGR